MTDAQKKKYPQVEQEFTEEGYPVLRLNPRQRSLRMFDRRKKWVPRRFVPKLKYREQFMKDDLDWPSIWPTPKTFVPSAVPLPLRQSYEIKPGTVPRGKYANTELLKICNFLHLTPVAIERQCRVLRKFCTKWPENLETDEQIRSHFPVTLITRDYCHSSPSIRDIRARCVTLQVNINDLRLQGWDRIKLIDLVEHRYDPQTEVLTIEAKDCPMRIQNTDYAEYLLSAVYFESQDHKEWENERFDEQAIHRIDLDEYRKTVEKRLGI